VETVLVLSTIRYILRPIDDLRFYLEMFPIIKNPGVVGVWNLAPLKEDLF
jgi:hypothetical protein